MRPDMHEVIIERPRRRPRGDDYPRARRARPDGEELPLREGMGRGYRQKYLNENLAPLRRFLARRVGRPWAKVFEEIAEHLSVSSAVQKHVVDHLQDLVVLHAWRDAEGSLWGAGRWGAPRRLRTHGRALLWVDRDTGILRRNDPEPRKLAKRLARPDPDVRTTKDGRELRRFRRVWYLVTTAPMPKPTWDPRAMRWQQPIAPLDALARKPAPAWPRYHDPHPLADLWASGRYVTTARPLTKRERIAWLG
jgi:hypothetical protein